MLANWEMSRLGSGEGETIAGLSAAIAAAIARDNVSNGGTDMIAQLRGSLVQTGGNHQTILDVHGVGYAVNVSGRTQGQLGTIGGEVTLLTEMQVREDSMTLFGFLDVAERDAFRLLITVQGVGAKAAMAILSVLAPVDLNNAIVSGDKAMVARADGVGPKIAQRVINELGEKIGKINTLGGALSISDAAGVSGGATGD